MLGHGTFVYDPDNAIEEYGSAKLAVDAMLNMGMGHAWLRVHNKNGAWRSSSNRKLADEILARGMSLGVWGWNDGNNLTQDIKNAKEAISSFKPDMYIASIEHNMSGANWSPKKAKEFCENVKSILGEKPLIVSSFGYIPYHEPEIMAEIDNIADYFAPQIYSFWFPKSYMLANDPVLQNLPTNNAAAYAKVCLHEWRKVVSKPLILTGQAYWGEASGWGKKQAENKLQEFIDGFDEYKTIHGLNWWNLSDSRAMSNKMQDLITQADLGGRLKNAHSTEGAEISQDTESVADGIPSVTSETSSVPSRMMIAAEGLYFRETPVGGTDENKIAELDYGASAEITGKKTANGYYPCRVDINGSLVSGFLHSAYLRPVENPKIERGVAEAVGEWKRFKKGSGWEDQEPYSSYINEMWTSVGFPKLTGKDTDYPWSAAFISFVLRNADYKRTKFDIRHSTYIHEAIQNRITGADRDFWGYRITETKPEVGDLICQWRVTETTFDEAEVQSKFSSHADLVIAVRPRAIITLGGNVTNAQSGNRGVTVETKTYSLNEDGALPDKKRVFAVMKNRHRLANINHSMI